VTWWLDRRFLLAGAVVLWTIWAVESLRKGGLSWPWPLVPLAVWIVVLWLVRRSEAPIRS
jgi:hypothetical protein